MSASTFPCILPREPAPRGKLALSFRRDFLPPRFARAVAERRLPPLRTERFEERVERREVDRFFTFFFFFGFFAICIKNARKNASPLFGKMIFVLSLTFLTPPFSSKDDRQDEGALYTFL